MSIRSARRIEGGLCEVVLFAPGVGIRRIVLPISLATFDNITFTAAAVSQLAALGQFPA